jgi:hypothetical protein
MLWWFKPEKIIFVQIESASEIEMGWKSFKSIFCKLFYTISRLFRIGEHGKTISKKVLKMIGVLSVSAYDSDMFSRPNHKGVSPIHVYFV